MVTTFKQVEVPHLFLGFNFYGHTTTDPELTDILNDEENEDGVPTTVLVDLVTKICLRDGLEYVCDQNLTETGVLELDEDYEIPVVFLEDWVALVSKE